MEHIKQSLALLADAKQPGRLAALIPPDAARGIVSHADELMQYTFTFDKPWDMERCLTPYTLSPLQWDETRNDDPEWCFMLNRMDYLDDLLLAALLTGDKRYAGQAKHLILHWIDAHPALSPAPSTRTLDTGIRVMNWLEALPYLYALDCLSDGELGRIADSMLQQMRYLQAHYLPKYKTSNWGSIQTCAIVAVLPFLSAGYAADPLYRWAKAEMELQFSIQVYPDGMQWEQSTMYHVEVLQYGMKALYYSQLQNETCPPVVRQQVHAQAKALLHVLTPSGEIDTFGDSDRVCARDVLTRAAILFGDAQLRFAGLAAPDAATLYLFGAPCAEAYAALSPQQPDATCYDGTDSGIYTARSGWDADASFTMFTNGSLGSGHGHSDNLHVSLWHRGAPVLIDPGRFTYREDHPLRVQLKGMPAHNSVMLDDKAYCVPSDSWGYADFGLPLKTYARHSGRYHYWEGALVGHDPLQLWVRKVIAIDPDIWMIVDEVKADGAHTAHSRLHFDPAAALTPQAGGYRIATPDGALTLGCTGETVLTSEPCSLRYNEQQPHTVLHSIVPFSGAATLVTTLCGGDITVQPVQAFQDLTVPTPDACVQARKFRLSDTESYTVAVYGQEIFRGKKVLSCEGMPYHAKCVVIHEKDGRKQLTLLKA